MPMLMSQLISLRREKIVAEAEKVSRAGGHWEYRGGCFYDTEKKAWVKKCPICKQLFYAYRQDALTCGDICRQKKSRKSKAV